MAVLDVHAHAVLEETMGVAGPLGPQMGSDAEGRPWFRVGDYVLDGVKYRGSPFLDVDLRLAAMDRAGIDQQMLSPNPLTYFHEIPADVGVPYCCTHNDAMAAVVARYPDRLLAAAALPMQDPAAAVAEARRAVGELGMVAAYVGTNLGGPQLDDEAYDEVYAALVDLDVPLFLHPASPSMLPGGDRRLARWDLDLLLGFAFEETLAVATLVFGGVLDRHPDLDICVSHGGGALPFVAGRFERAVEVRRWSPDSVRQTGFAGAIGRLWFDSHVHGKQQQDLLLSVVAKDRLVFGTNFAGWDSGAAAELDATAEQYSANSRRLLRLDRLAPAAVSPPAPTVPARPHRPRPARASRAAPAAATNRAGPSWCRPPGGAPDRTARWPRTSAEPPR
jgi:aminocarboxymuconate-semialdehyde decarboxylase